MRGWGDGSVPPASQAGGGGGHSGRGEHPQRQPRRCRSRRKPPRTPCSPSSGAVAQCPFSFLKRGDAELEGSPLLSQPEGPDAAGERAHVQEEAEKCPLLQLTGSATPPRTERDAPCQGQTTLLGAGPSRPRHMHQPDAAAGHAGSQRPPPPPHSVSPSPAFQTFLLPWVSPPGGPGQLRPAKPPPRQDTSATGRVSACTASLRWPQVPHTPPGQGAPFWAGAPRGPRWGGRAVPRGNTARHPELENRGSASGRGRVRLPSGPQVCPVCPPLPSTRTPGGVAEKQFGHKGACGPPDAGRRDDRLEHERPRSPLVTVVRRRRLRFLKNFSHASRSPLPSLSGGEECVYFASISRSFALKLFVTSRSDLASLVHSTNTRGRSETWAPCV